MSQGVSGEGAGEGAGASVTALTSASPVSTIQTTGWLWVSNGASGTTSLALTQPLPGWRDIFTNPTDPPLPAPPQMIGGTYFPEGAWDPLLKAAAIAAYFASIPGWQDKCDPGAPNVDDDDLLKDEALLAANAVDPVLQSATRANEIMAQATDFTPYWANLLSCSAASRPATWSLVLVAMQVGGLAAAYYKLKYMRARPAQVWPVISPIIPTPAHPSYPSGHSTQCHLIAECVKFVVPALGSACDILANRIAFNRELAGVHFPTDTAAGKKIATLVRPLLTGLAEFEKIGRQMQTEWAKPRTIVPPKIPTGSSPPSQLPPPLPAS